ncbi:terminase large subunit [Isoptericola dokdonensis]|uniref:Phage Terminase n=1 Tax=Isoptericola dokdonensis DS-3 TaxID=1300344 RepID=A0A161ILN5_9MICO|nr:terminase TerL endonuclease subunit [Isoptericola dokdonensis]ANC31440.1 Phage Terminase [Isoptericola dokdonensis DS-3]
MPRTKTPSTDGATTRAATRSGDPAKRATAEARRSPSAAKLRRLKISPEVAWYLDARDIPLPDCPPAFKTPEPREVPGAVFDPERVDRVLASFRALRHVAGRWAGQPLEPDPWQIAHILAPVFGWVRWDDESDGYVRVIRDLYVDVPRKNGKSTLSAGIAIYMACADGEQGAQVVTAATTKDQARFVFTPIRTLAERAPALKSRVKALSEKVIHPRSGSYIEVVSSVADAQHGANIHCSIVDELHVHKTADLVETIETGRGSRTQPLSVIITTADSGRPGTIYARKRELVERLSRGIITDESIYGVVWAAGKKDDPHVESTWRKANPGFGISPTKAYLAAESRKAQNSPADLAAFLRLHLGIRTKQDVRFIDLDAWDANAGDIVDEHQLDGRTAYGGLDLGSVSDLTALCWLMPRDHDDGYDAVWRFWLPEDALDDLDRRTAGEASLWVEDGWLDVTPGNVTDYAYVRQQIEDDLDWLDVETVGFDRWNATQLSIDLMEDGVEMVKVGQGYASTSAPMKELQRLILRGKSAHRPMLHHGGNPVMRWMTDNLAVARDPAGNVKPDKAAAAEKIDGWSALVNAMSEAMANGDGGSDPVFTTTTT